MSSQPIDHGLYPALVQKLLAKAMLPHSLGRLEAVALQVAMLQRTLSPALKIPCLLLAAGDHGVTAQGVTTSPREITWQQCRNFAQGGGACGLLAKANGVQLLVCDVGVDHDFLPADNILDCKVAYGTKDFLLEPAMTIGQCEKAMDHGSHMVQAIHDNGSNVVLFGEMGIGNTTSASALACALSGLEPCEMTTAGAAQDEAGYRRKCEVVAKAIAKHGTAGTPIDLLACFGGYELAFITGGMLKAASLGMVVVLDGFIVTVCALVASKMDANVTQYMIPAHLSSAKGHDVLLDMLQVGTPLLDLGMCLGEGTGALAAWPLIRNAVSILNDMTEFSQGGVTDSTRLAIDSFGEEVFS